MSAITTITQVYGAKVSLLEYFTFINNSDEKERYNKELKDDDMDTTIEEIVDYLTKRENDEDVDEDSCIDEVILDLIHSENNVFSFPHDIEEMEGYVVVGVKLGEFDITSPKSKFVSYKTMKKLIRDFNESDVYKKYETLLEDANCDIFAICDSCACCT